LRSHRYHCARWEVPGYRFKKRPTSTLALKSERGWIEPNKDKSGNLKLSVDDRWQAFGSVLRIAEEHRLYVANGGTISDE
jgi:hypothetical protein